MICSVRLPNRLLKPIDAKQCKTKRNNVKQHNLVYPPGPLGILFAHVPVLSARAVHPCGPPVQSARIIRLHAAVPHSFSTAALSPVGVACGQHSWLHPRHPHHNLQDYHGHLNLTIPSLLKDQQMLMVWTVLVQNVVALLDCDICCLLKCSKPNHRTMTSTCLKSPP